MSKQIDCGNDQAGLEPKKTIDGDACDDLCHQLCEDTWKTEKEEPGLQKRGTTTDSGAVWIGGLRLCF